MSDRWIGKSVRRVEDFRLLTGRGAFIDDHPPVGNIHHAAIVRSRHAHARVVGYDVTRARAAEGVVAVITGEHEAEVVLRERFRFPKYGSTPIETYGIIARWELDGVCTVWSNFMGPFIMHPLTARVLGLAENKLRFIVPPDIGGSFGIKSSIYPYIALIALAAKHAGVPVKWIEDRREHLLASSSGTDRVAYREVAAKKDGTVLGMRFRWLDNVGGYIRSPEPGCSFRPTGNFVGPYGFQ